MKNYILFLFWGIVFIAPAEYIINTMIVPGGSFVGAVFMYTILLTGYYIIRKKWINQSESHIMRLGEIIVLGLFGLFVMEWYIIGNSPTDNPDAVQSSMFIWWVWVFIFPKIMISQQYAILRKPVILYHILFSSAFWGYMLFTGIPLSFIVIYAYGLWVFYYFSYRYIKIHPQNITRESIGIQ